MQRGLWCTKVTVQITVSRVKRVSGYNIWLGNPLNCIRTDHLLITIYAAVLW